MKKILLLAIIMLILCSAFGEFGDFGGDDFGNIDPMDAFDPTIPMKPDKWVSPYGLINPANPLNQTKKNITYEDETYTAQHVTPVAYPTSTKEQIEKVRNFMTIFLLFLGGILLLMVIIMFVALRG